MLYALAVFVVVFSLVSIFIVKMIYDYQFPQFPRHDETITASLRYEDIQQDYPREKMHFHSGPNRLQGYLYGEQTADKLLVVVHGLGGGADSYLPQIRYFVDQGWRVFAFDATGSFDSEGHSTIGFPQIVVDLDHALNFINDHDELSQLPLALFGHSWGGYAVTAILNYDHDIKGVVSVSAANSAMDMIMEQGRRMMGSMIEVQKPFLWLYQRYLFGEVMALTGVDGINNQSIPVYILHGTEDDVVDFNGSALISQRNITNENTVITPLTHKNRNGHNNIFRSEEAIAYIETINQDYRNLYEEHNEAIPYEINQAFYERVDRFKVQDLDLKLMDSIHNFLVKAIGQ